MIQTMDTLHLGTLRGTSWGASMGQIVESKMEKTGGSLRRNAVRDGALGTLSRVGTELRICTTTRAWARRPAKVRSPYGELSPA